MGADREFGEVVSGLSVWYPRQVSCNIIHQQSQPGKIPLNPLHQPVKKQLALYLPHQLILNAFLKVAENFQLRRLA